MPPERYFECYASLLEADAPRFIDQPVYDTDKPIYNELGEEIGYEQIGTRKFDLAPEYEWVMWADHLDNSVIAEIKRTYAWERNHPYSRAAYEERQERERLAKEQERTNRRLEAAADAFEEVFAETRKKVHFGYGDTRNER